MERKREGGEGKGIGRGKERRKGDREERGKQGEIRRSEESVSGPRKPLIRLDKQEKGKMWRERD